MLKRLFHSSRIYCAVRVGLSLVFIWAGAVKLADPRAFARIISEYGLVPDLLLVPLAIGLPAVELLGGLGLAFDFRGCLKVITGLLFVFLLVLGYGIVRNLDVDCGCFSADEIHARNSLRIALFRDLGLLGLVSYLFYWRWVHARLNGACARNN